MCSAPAGSSTPRCSISRARPRSTSRIGSKRPTSIGLWSNDQKSRVENLSARRGRKSDLRRQCDRRRRQFREQLLQPQSAEPGQCAVAEDQYARQFRLGRGDHPLRLPHGHPAKSLHRRSDRREFHRHRQDHAARRHQLDDRRRQGHLAAGRAGRRPRGELRRARRPLRARQSGRTGPRPGLAVRTRRRSSTPTASARRRPPRSGCRMPGALRRSSNSRSGGRWESWRAFDGFNLNTTTVSTTGAITGTTTINQPTLSAARFSPKAALSYEPNKDWQVTGSFGVANRFPTVTELYQIGHGRRGPIINPKSQPRGRNARSPANSRSSASSSTARCGSRCFRRTRTTCWSPRTARCLAPRSPRRSSPTSTRSATAASELAWQKNNVLIDRVELFGQRDLCRFHHPQRSNLRRHPIPAEARRRGRQARSQRAGMAHQRSAPPTARPTPWR